MSIRVSDVMHGLATQQVNGLIIVLKKAKKYCEQSGTDYATLLSARLQPDMFPLAWQLNATLEILVRGAARLSHAQLIGLSLHEDETDFDGLIARIEGLRQHVLGIDSAVLDQSANEKINAPFGAMPMTGKEFVLTSILPNFYFHLTTSYDLFRMSGVAVGKNDYLGKS